MTSTIAAPRLTTATGPAAQAGVVALVVIGLGLAATGLQWTGDDDALGWLWFALVMVWGVAGWMVSTRPRLQGLGMVAAGGAAVGALAFVAGAAAGRDWSSTTLDLANAISIVAAQALAAIGAHFLLALPTGRLETSGRRALVGFVYAAEIAVGLACVVGPGERSVGVAWLSWIAALGLALPGSHARYLATAGLDRQRVQWLGCGAAAALEAVLVVGTLHVLVDWPGHAGPVAAAVSVLVPVSFAAGSWPRVAARVDRLLVHTVSFTGVTVVTVAVYLVVVVGLGRVPEGADRDVLALSLVAAAVACVLYVPTRTRLADAANRLVYGERHAPDDVLRTFGSRLTRAIPMDELLLQLAESLRKTLMLRRAEVWTGTSELLERTVSVPYADPIKLAIGDKERPVIARAGVSGPAWVSVWLPALLDERPASQLRVTPVTHSGELLGLIVVERDADGDTFAADDELMLTELARQAGLALHNVQLDSALQATLDEVRRTNEELRASRARIVATTDAERRRIERDLHDGAQQHLVALAVNLRLAKDLLTDDPEGAAEMLDQLAGDVKETVAELRNLAHGIYPPLLVDSGLGEALRAAAGRSPLGVEVVSDGIGRYPSDVEAAVYFCCLEALQNAAKHAPGSTVELRLWEEEGGLLFEVSDNGPGFDAAARGSGHGFTNMSDRLGAIGGSVRWDSTIGQGSSVRGSVPLTTRA